MGGWEDYIFHGTDGKKDPNADQIRQVRTVWCFIKMKTQAYVHVGRQKMGGRIAEGTKKKNLSLGKMAGTCILRVIVE